MGNLWLPGEVWALVLAHLSASDKLRVRTTCKYFRDLVDSDLWKDSTVELRSSDDSQEQEHFWNMVHRVEVTSLRLSCLYDWTRIAKELPQLTTLKTLKIIKRAESYTDLYDLNLTRIAVHLDDLSLFMPQQLEQLIVCHSTFRIQNLTAGIPPDSLLSKLKSLTFHSYFGSHPVNVLHFFLSSLPQLEHLSLSMDAYSSYEGHISDLPPVHNCSLSSLELVDTKCYNLPLDLMAMFKTVPSLRSLAIFCIDVSDGGTRKLSGWLRDLPTLTSLLVKGIYMQDFIRSIPSSVTHLTLLPRSIEAEELALLSTQLLNLQHLHLVPYEYNLVTADTVLLPELSPALRTVHLCHDKVSYNTLLSAASLKQLQVLEIEGTDPWPEHIISKIRAQTNNRVRIYKRPESVKRFCRCKYF